MNSILLRLRRVTALASCIAVAAAAGVLAFTATNAGQAAGMRAHDHAALTPTRTAQAIRFHDRMRALWEEHGSWTRMVIVSFVGNLPDLSAAEQVLLDRRDCF
jgi:hypothetical protein